MSPEGATRRGWTDPHRRVAFRLVQHDPAWQGSRRRTFLKPRLTWFDS